MNISFGNELLFSKRWGVSTAPPPGITSPASTPITDAANAGTARYLNAAATGAGTGLNWSDAWTTTSAANAGITRGQTLAVADGVYASGTFDKATSGTTLISVIKATAGDHGTETGWNSGLGDGIAEWPSLNFNSSYWLWDGVTGGGPSAWKTGFGFYINGVSGGNLHIQNGSTNITCRHFEVVGMGAGGSNSQDLIGLYEAGSGPVTFSYFYLHDADRCCVFNRVHNVTLEYGQFGKFQSTSGQHAETASVWIDFAQTKVQNFIVRWSLITDAGTPDSTGGFITLSDNAQFYGNIFQARDGGSFTAFGNGLIGTWTADSMSNMKAYNNTFIGPCSRVFGLFDGPFELQKSSNIKNNLFYNVTVGNDSQGYTAGGTHTHTHNYYNTISDGPVTEATQQTASGNPFVDSANQDYRLLANTTAGTDLGSPYNIDMLGHTRTTWTRGALEFQ